MSNPKIIGRFGEDEKDIGAEAELICEVFVPLCINGEGEVKVSVFKSTDFGNRGGFILKISMDKQDSGFQPFAVNFKEGAELHIAGEIEARAVITALKAAVSSL